MGISRHSLTKSNSPLRSKCFSSSCTKASISGLASATKRGENAATPICARACDLWRAGPSINCSTNYRAGWTHRILVQISTDKTVAETLISSNTAIKIRASQRCASQWCGRPKRRFLIAHVAIHRVGIINKRLLARVVSKALWL